MGRHGDQIDPSFMVARRASSLQQQISDRLTVIPEIQLQYIGSIVADIKSLTCKFSSMSFVHVTRANEVAHVLAQSGEQSAYSAFQCCIPGCIQEIGYYDLLSE